MTTAYLAAATAAQALQPTGKGDPKRWCRSNRFTVSAMMSA